MRKVLVKTEKICAFCIEKEKSKREEDDREEII